MNPYVGQGEASPSIRPEWQSRLPKNISPQKNRSTTSSNVDLPTQNKSADRLSFANEGKNYQPSRYANINGATMVASLSTMNFGV